MKDNSGEDIFMMGILACCAFLISVTITLYFLSGEDPGKYIVLKEEIKEYELVSIDPPKHFFVDLKEKKSGIIFKHVYISKHCPGWEKLKLSSVYLFKEIIYKYEKAPDNYTKIEINPKVLCDA